MQRLLLIILVSGINFQLNDPDWGGRRLIKESHTLQPFIPSTLDISEEAYLERTRAQLDYFLECLGNSHDFIFADTLIIFTRRESAQRVRFNAFSRDMAWMDFHSHVIYRQSRRHPINLHRKVLLPDETAAERINIDTEDVPLNIGKNKYKKILKARFNIISILREDEDEYADSLFRYGMDWEEKKSREQNVRPDTFPNNLLWIVVRDGRAWKTIRYQSLGHTLFYSPPLESLTYSYDYVRRFSQRDSLTGCMVIPRTDDHFIFAHQSELYSEFCKNADSTISFPDFLQSILDKKYPFKWNRAFRIIPHIQQEALDDFPRFLKKYTRELPPSKIYGRRWEVREEYLNLQEQIVRMCAYHGYFIFSPDFPPHVATKGRWLIMERGYPNYYRIKYDGPENKGK